MTSSGRAVRTLAHAASLIFGAWWLVATSSPYEPGPAHDCFTGLANPTRLEITLGQRNAVSTSDEGLLPPCDGIDGLATNATPVFDLSQGPRPEDTDGCYGYDTQAIGGAPGVTVQPGPKEGARALTSASGTFVSPDLPGCDGTWSLSLYPERDPPAGGLTSPLEAGADERWIVQRLIRSNRPSACLETFARAGVLTCGDGFSVVSIRELAAP